MIMRLFVSVGAIVAVAVGLAAPATAQDYPDKDIHVVVGFPAGSGADVYARYFANKLSVLSKQTVIVETSREPCRASPPNCGALEAGRLHDLHRRRRFLRFPLYLFKKPPVDPRKDFVYISPLVSQGFILVVTADKPFKTVADLTADLKEKGDKASYATANNPATILAETYKKSAGFHRAGQLQDQHGLSQRHDGRPHRLRHGGPGVRAVPHPRGQDEAAGDLDRPAHQVVADIPTLQEAGIAGVDMNLWWVVAAPAGTPQPIVDKLNGWFTEIGKMDETREFLAKFGAEPFTASPAETTKLVDKEIADWENYVKLAKIEAQ